MRATTVCFFCVRELRRLECFSRVYFARSRLRHASKKDSKTHTNTHKQTHKHTHTNKHTNTQTHKQTQTNTKVYSQSWSSLGLATRTPSLSFMTTVCQSSSMWQYELDMKIPAGMARSPGTRGNPETLRTSNDLRNSGQ